MLKNMFISGIQAFKFAQLNNSIKQRYSGSFGNLKAIKMIQFILEQYQIPYYIDTFKDITPKGRITFNNLVVDLKGKFNDYFIIGCHHDTKFLPQYLDFTGANDGSSGVGLLLNLIIYFYKNTRFKLPYGLKFIFFDGEQSIMQYSNKDGLHGSKFAAKKCYKNCLSMILLDMIGYKDLKIQFPINSNKTLVDITKTIIDQLNYNQFFNQNIRPNKIIDDTTPFEYYNVPTINFIQMDYPYWHTNNDTFDKLSSNSFKIVGDVVISLIKKLQTFNLRSL